VGGRARFKDHFSSRAAEYARYRPGYPSELFAWFAGLVERRRVAWDCATGNGQAAVGLAAHFDRVVATDLSRQQLAQAARHPGVTYCLTAAERSCLASAAVDLTAVGQAIHWFDFEAFYTELRRVSRPRAVLAVWTYHRLEASPEVYAALTRFRSRVERFWPPERKWVEERYLTLPFPFEEIEAPVFTHEEEWDLERLMGYLGTWSAASRYRAATGHDPLAEAREEMAAAWGDPAQARRLRWPLHLRAGRVGRVGRG
jgi:SAM-dependent methyltransferase